MTKVILKNKSVKKLAQCEANTIWQPDTQSMRMKVILKIITAEVDSKTNEYLECWNTTETILKIPKGKKGKHAKWNE